LDSPNGYDDGYYQEGDWHDTLLMADDTGNKFRARMQTDTFTGKMVVHCHKLQHEDNGMMNFIMIDGTEGATFECAKSLGTSCYTDAFDASTVIKHPVDESCIEANSSPSPTPAPSNDMMPYILGISVMLIALVVGGGAIYCMYGGNKQEDEERTELAEARQETAREETA